MNNSRSLRQRAWYYTRIYADPQDENIVYASNVSFQRSRDGGRTFQNVGIPHSDSHDLWIAPNNNQRMIEANDGGANVSTDGGRTWTDQDFATAQFYHVTTTNHFPYRVCGAQQDNSTACLSEPRRSSARTWPTFTTRAAGSRATSRSGPTIPTSSMRGATAGS